MTTLPNMGIVLPTRGDAGSGEWHDTIDANYGREDAHDHSPGKGPRVPTNGISINADLTFASLYAPINLHRITFASIVALTSNNKSLFVNASDNELYWRSNAGANVKLTSGNALNVAAFVGGIGGDYSAVSALVDYDDATDTYRFRQETAASVRQFAKMKCADIQLVEYDPSGDASVPANTVTLKSPDALAGNYSVTMPAAAPGSTQIVQMDSSGVLTASNTIVNTLTLPATVAGAADFTGAITMASTLGVTGLITATAGVTAVANQHVTVSGTGRLKHGARELCLHISAFQPDASTTYIAFTQAGYLTGISAVAVMCAPVLLEVGKRIVSYQQFYDVAGTGAGILPRLRRMTLSTGTITNVASGVSDTTGTGLESQTLSAINHTVLSGEAYFVEVTLTNAAHRCHGAIITYDDP